MSDIHPLLPVCIRQDYNYSVLVDSKPSFYLMIKKTSLVLFFFILSISAVEAQFAKSDFLIEGLVSLNQTSSDRVYPVNRVEGVIVTDQTFTTRLNPTVHFFITNNLSISLGAGFQYRDFDFSQGGFTANGFGFFEVERVTKSLIITPGIRLYHPVSDKVSFYTGISTLFGKGKQETTSPSFNFLEADTYDFETSLRHGVSFQVTRAVILSASTSSLFYFFSRQEPEGADINIDDKEFGLNNFSALALSVGYKF